MPRVLIIEDDAENRRVMAQFFTREHWNVLEAKDGDAGVELALRNRPELILCDLLMPKSNGFEVCRSIREQLQPTKIIVVSGRDYGVDRTSALEAGADEYLLKPITWELLSSTIDRLLPEIPRRPEPKSVTERESVPARIRLWGVRGSIPVPGNSARSRFGQRIRTSLDEVDSFDLAHSLGSYSGTAFLFSRVQAEKSHPRFGL